MQLERVAAESDLDDLFLIGIDNGTSWEVRERSWSLLERDMPEHAAALRRQLGPLEEKVGFFLRLSGDQCFSGTLARPALPVPSRS